MLEGAIIAFVLFTIVWVCDYAYTYYNLPPYFKHYYEIDAAKLALFYFIFMGVGASIGYFVV